MRLPPTSWLQEYPAVLLLTVELHLHATIQLDFVCSWLGRFSVKPEKTQRKEMIQDKIIINRRISGGMLRDQGKEDQWLFLSN